MLVVGAEIASPLATAVEGKAMPLAAFDCSVLLLLIDPANELVVLFAGGRKPGREPWKELLLGREENDNLLPSPSTFGGANFPPPS